MLLKSYNNPVSFIIVSILQASLASKALKQDKEWRPGRGDSAFMQKSLGRADVHGEGLEGSLWRPASADWPFPIRFPARHQYARKTEVSGRKIGFSLFQ
jgi:hypothetical protein